MKRPACLIATLFILPSLPVAEEYLSVRGVCFGTSDRAKQLLHVVNLD